MGALPLSNSGKHPIATPTPPPKRPLGRHGTRLTTIGFGAGPLGDVYGALDERTAGRVVRHAYERGIRYFDTSPYYGRGLSERRLGAALRGLRSRVFLATKGGRQDLAAFDFRAAPLAASLEESLRRLQTDWIDLYQLHDIEFAPRALILEEALPTLERLRAQGKIRFIGISGYPPSLLRDIAENFPLDTVLSYCQHNLLIENIGELVACCAARGIALLNASVLHMGVLTAAGASPWHPAPPAVHEASARAAALAAEQGEDLARIALRFALQETPAAATLIGMSSEAEVDAALSALQETTPPELFAEVRAALAPAHGILWRSGRPEHWEAGARPAGS